MSTFKVVLRAVSCIHMPEGALARVDIHEPSLPAPIEMKVFSEYAEGVPADLVILLTGQADNYDIAVNRAGSVAQIFLDVLSAMTSSHIQIPRLCAVFSVSFDEAERPCRVLAPPSKNQDHPIVYRSVASDKFLDVIGLVISHKFGPQMLSIASKLAQAIRMRTPFNSMVGGNFVYMAAETLGTIIRKLLLEENKLTSVQELGIHMGLTPNADGKVNPNAVDSAIRLQHVFQGNDVLYKTIKNASDGFEHGYGEISKWNTDFNQNFDPAFASVRHSWLAQLPNDPVVQEIVTDKLYELPLMGWLPQLVLEGTIPESAKEQIAKGDYLRMDVEGRWSGRLDERNRECSPVDVRLVAKDLGTAASFHAVSQWMPGHGNVEMTDVKAEVIPAMGGVTDKI